MLNSTAPAPASFIPVFLLCPGVSLSDATAAGVVRELERDVGSLHENVANCVQMRGGEQGGGGGTSGTDDVRHYCVDQSIYNLLSKYFLAYSAYTLTPLRSVQSTLHWETPLLSIGS